MAPAELLNLNKIMGLFDFDKVQNLAPRLGHGRIVTFLSNKRNSCFSVMLSSAYDVEDNEEDE